MIRVSIPQTRMRPVLFWIKSLHKITTTKIASIWQIDAIYATRSFSIIAIVLALFGCATPPTNPTQTPVTATPKPACTIMPQPTGEKLIPIVQGTPPPLQVKPGEQFTLSFSGGYMIMNNARTCGDDGIVTYIYSDELPGYSYERSVQVLLDGEDFVRPICDYDCQLAITLPDTLEPGPHDLQLDLPFFNEVAFDLIVVTPTN